MTPTAGPPGSVWSRRCLEDARARLPRRAASTRGRPFSPSSCCGRLRRGLGGAFGGVASMRSGELPRANGIGLVGFGARSTRLRAAIEVGQIRARRHLGRGLVEPRLHEHEPARSRSRCCSSWARFCSSIAFCRCSRISLHPRHARTEQNRDQRERVDVDGNQHAFPPRQRLRNPRRVGTIVVEVEVHQGLNDYNSSWFGVLGSWFRFMVSGFRFFVQGSGSRFSGSQFRFRRFSFPVQRSGVDLR